jgi:hypothetical protein
MQTLVERGCGLDVQDSQSRKASSSRVVVPNVRTCFWTFPFCKTINKQATTVAWWKTSQQRKADSSDSRERTQGACE